MIQQPNFFGTLEDVDALTDWAHAQGAFVIAVVNPTSLAVLKPPGEWARRVPTSSSATEPLTGRAAVVGRTVLRFHETRMDCVRSMPGRIVGRTVDLNGKEGFTLTLQAREQHIRRGKATSNICTNQGLLMTAATIYLSLLGPTGLGRVASLSHQRTQELVTASTRIKGVRVAFAGPRLHEAVLQFDRPVAPMLRELEQRRRRRTGSRRALSGTRSRAARLRDRDQDQRRHREALRCWATPRRAGGLRSTDMVMAQGKRSLRVLASGSRRVHQRPAGDGDVSDILEALRALLAAAVARDQRTRDGAPSRGCRS
ncbi:MAG: hypothetical protein R3E65_06745 [Steroidobacteraceae bacterium]